MATSKCPSGRVATVDLGQTGVGEGRVASPEEWQRVARELRQAFSDTGCAYLSNHGIPAAVLTQALAAEREFFALDEAVKKRFSAKGTIEGYIPFNSERYGSHANQLHESFLTNTANMDFLDSQLPSLIPATSQLLEAFLALSSKLLAALDLSLGKEKGYFRSVHRELGTKEGLSVLRFNHFPPLPSITSQDSIRFGAHIDFTTLTILFTGNQSGLQICDRDGVWLDVAPNNLLVMAGEFLHFYSNKEFVATEHRVALPAEEGLGVSRYSIIYFVHPDRHVPMWLPGAPSDPPAPNAKDYLFGKMKESGHVKGKDKDVTRMSQ